ncbi:MAG TPA: LLM class flavin-dependent oxidoreductase [Ardenticatenaceae bacterium]|jgi:5,10-methylenetetrahydromethanopterin reductase
MPESALGRLSIAFQGDKPLREYGELATMVEQYPFDTISLYADLLFQPPFTPLLLMAQATRRVNVGVAAVNPFLFHPLTVAGDIALLDEASGGRAYLGVARGAWLDAIGLESRDGPRRMREFIEAVNHLLARDPTSYAGKHFRLAEGATLRWPPIRSRVPVMVGTWGPETVAATIHLMDDVKIGGCVNPAMVRRMREYLRQAATKAGVDDECVTITAGAVCVVAEDGALARAIVRRELALYLPVVLSLDTSEPIDEEELARVQAGVERGDLQGAADSISEATLRRFALAGTPEEVARHCGELFDAGVGRIEFGTPHGLSEVEGIRLLGERVLPALR